jgi:hypothetical protein
LSEEIKLIFDECLSRPIVEALRPFLEKSGVSLKTESVVETQRSGIADKVWIPKIAAEGGWIVISADRGKSNREKFSEKLPYLCRAHRVTHVLLSARVHELTLFAKGQALVAVWAEFLKVKSAVAGTRFMLKKRDRGDGFQLVNSDTPQPPRQPGGAPKPKETALGKAAPASPPRPRRKVDRGAAAKTKRKNPHQREMFGEAPE